MTERSLVARLRAEISGFKGPMTQAAESVKRVGDEAERSQGRVRGAMGRMSSAAKENRAAWDSTTQTVARGAMAVQAGLVLAGKAAIDWESAWTGVSKTVDGTAAQMAQLEDSLRGLTKELPATHSEIAGVAEAAGQLGVKRADVVGFTETMIKLGESTNLTAEQAATGIAQISNVMGTMEREGVGGVQRFGAALVALGNAGASTEAEILDMAARLAGAGKLVGATEADVLALANAMASVGIEAQLGGGVMSRVMTQINSAVLSGSDGVEEFARVAGMSAEAFSRQWKDRPAEALASVVAGLSRMQAQGVDTAGALADMGIKGTENLQVMLRLAGASDLLTSSLDLGKKAWSENAALNEEFAKRNATTAAQLRRSMSQLRDAAIDIGQVVAPVAADLAGLLAAFASGFQAIPGPLQKVLVGVTALGAGGLLAAAGIGKVHGVVKSAKAVFDGMARSSALAAQQYTTVATKAEAAAGGISRTERAARGAGKALGYLAIAGVAVGAMQDDMQALGSEQLIKGLGSGKDALTAINDELMRVNSGELGMFNAGVRDLGDALKFTFSAGFGSQADNALGSILGVVGVSNRSDIAEATARLQELDATMAQLAASGDSKKAAELMSAIAKEAERQGISVQDLAEKFPQYQEALAGVDNESKRAESAQSELAAAMGETGDSAQSAADELQRMLDVISGLDDAVSNARQTESDWRAAIDDATAAAKENGATVNAARNEIDLHTEAGRANDRALRDLAASTLDFAASSVEMGGDVDEATARVQAGREEFVRQARQMGLTREAAERYADQLGMIPETVRTTLEASTATAYRALANYELRLRGLDGKVVTTRVVTEYLNRGSRSTAGGLLKEDGGIVIPYADGGYAASGRYVERVSRIERGGANILWAEPATGWEAYISGKPSQRARNEVILADVASRFGGRYTPAEDGRGPGAGAASTGLSSQQFQALLGAVRKSLGDLTVRADGREIARLVADDAMARR